MSTNIAISCQAGHDFVGMDYEYHSMLIYFNAFKRFAQWGTVFDLKNL
jgi:hypothetical protein